MVRPRLPALRACLGCSAVILGLGRAWHATPARAQEGAGEQALRRAVTVAIGAMTPAQRAGQLFLVGFQGPEAADGSGIARLIDAHHIGGVVLDPSRGNFTNAPDAPTQVARLTNDLQARADAADGPFVPLLIGLAQGGDAYPDSPLFGGMTALPSQMALGATWHVDHAAKIGAIVGGELAAVGVNLLIGPNLDVVAEPRPAGSGDLGVRAFGGSPAWVGRFGRQFVEGVHRGSNGRVATAAGSFPGIGGADRSPSDEVAVVESPLDQLEQTELPPFVAVTAAAEAPLGVTDALITSHVRYRGIQQQGDRPFALDSGGLRYLRGQIGAFQAWRDPAAGTGPAAGGVLITAGLGQVSVRRYIDPELEAFSGRRVVREALLAGNDLLTVTNFGPPEDPAADVANVEDAIAWLVGEYEADEAVRARVDDALRRVLTLKHRLYGGFSAARAGVNADEAAARTGLGGEDVAAVARAAVTLISPSGGAAVEAPQPGDRLLLVVDTREAATCPGCGTFVSLDRGQMLDVVRRAYGPEGAGTARLRANDDVSAITFRDVKLWLQDSGNVSAEDTPVWLDRARADAGARDVGAAIGAADWIVFAMRDPRPAEAPASDALRLFLKAGPVEAEGRRVVAIAFGAPYHLDTTEIASLSAYYTVYARTEPFVETAMRVLFGDVSSDSASPVSVPGAGYDLAARLEPAEDQRVAIEAVGWDAGQPVARDSAFRVRTTPIRDTNGNLVPDGTLITFRRYDRADDVFLADVPAATDDGRAMAEMRAEREGEIEVTVARDNALLSEPLVVRVEGAGLGLGRAPGAVADAAAGLVRPHVPVDWGILFLSLSLILLAGVLVYGADPEAVRSPARLVRLFLLSLAWGLAGYLLVGAGGVQLRSLPGGANMWPAGWNAAYQAPIVAFALALMPVVPTIARALRRRGG